MRRLKVVVAVSLTLNLLLGIVYLLGFPRPSKSPDLAIGEGSASQMEAQIAEKRTNIVAVAAPARAFDWRTVESEDYKEYIANLRKIGCPEKTVQNVIVADVNDLFRERYRKLFPTTNGVEYWKPGNPLANLFDEEMIATQRVMRAEERETIKSLLGAPYTDEDDLSAIQLDSNSERLLNFLTPEKRTAMKELEDSFAVKKMKTYKDAWRGDDTSSEALQAQKDEAMLKVLTPDEKLEYDLRRSDAAVVLRVGLKNFELSEDEFRAVFPAVKEFLAAAGKPGFGTMMLGQPDPRPEGAAARAVLRTKLAAALGAERFQQMIDQTGWNLATEEQPPP